MNLLICSQLFNVSYPKTEFDDCFNEFSHRQIQTAPIITFYGKTSEGKKAAVHIHKVFYKQFFPRFYVEVPESYLEDPLSFAIKLEKKFNPSAPMIIHKIDRVQKLSIYGYQTSKTTFFKIEVYNSEHIKRLGEMCLEGIDGFHFQPYEAHIDTFQHFYSEFGLSGMDWMRIEKVTYRNGCGFPASSYKKETRSELECDCLYTDIQKNSQYIGSEFGAITLPPVYKIWKKEYDQRTACNQVINERMPRIPDNNFYPQDFIKNPDFLQNLLRASSLPCSNLDYLFPYANPESDFLGEFEDSQKKFEESLDIFKPKSLVSSPQKATILERMLKSNFDAGSNDKLLQKPDSNTKKDFYFGEIRLKFTLKYKWNRPAPSYTEIKQRSKYGIRCINQKIYVSDKRNDLLIGITDKSIINNGKINNNPDFAQEIFNIASKYDLSSNQYLYKKPSPSYDYIFNESRQSTQASCLTPIEKNISLKPSVFAESLPLCLMYIEVFAKNKSGKLPNPAEDSVFFVAIKVRDDLGVSFAKIIQIGEGVGIHYGKHSIIVEYANNEDQLFNKISDIITDADPDIIISYEAEKNGIGYLIKRSKRLNSDFITKSSRQKKFIVQQTYRFKKLSSLLPGRVILSCWRLVQMQTSFYSYSLQSVLYSCLKIRIPFISPSNLTNICDENLRLVYDYIWDTLHYSNKIIEHYGFLERNVTLAQIFGIDYESVFTRGSQFRVEAMLKKQIKGTDFLLLSAMKDQVFNQTKIQSVPLVIEPPKKFLTDPVVVLDFQSLYPSIMIAYNLCYSTCLGKVASQKYKKFGVTHMKGDVFRDQDIIIAPNNVAFVKKEVRQGLIPKMMHELLQTRILIKNSMKSLDKGSARYHQLFVEQLGIKMLCNTTYGYAGAGETGRMPCNDIADSIVAIARKTLEAAIETVNSEKNWDAQVIYGDTDSMMILLKGRTVEQAFAVGKEIAERVTSMNPKPVELILEKVYFPMLTLAKKHYAGMKYEKPDSVPYYDAKGIETVRRDFCSLASKILEDTLIRLFESRDLSNIHSFLVTQWTKILKNKFPLQEFIMYEKVILGDYKNPPAGIKVSSQNMEIDKMRKPLFGERVGYVFVSGQPGDMITDLAVDPKDFIESNKFTLNIEYYMEKQVNAVLDRSLSVLGIDIKIWYKNMPKKRGVVSIQNLQPSKGNLKKINDRIDKFFKSANCFVCKKITSEDLCEVCASTPQTILLAVMSNMNYNEQKLLELNSVCRGCSGSVSEILCTSIDCPVYYSRIKLTHQISSISEKLKSLSW